MDDHRFDIDPVTIPLAELLLSKAQIVQLNRKDALDIISLLLNNDLGKDSEGKIGLDRIAFLCSHDWGLYKTSYHQPQTCRRSASRAKNLNLTESEKNLISDRVRRIEQAIEDIPKSLAWKLRDKVGTRVRWYEEVEEVDR